MIGGKIPIIKAGICFSLAGFLFFSLCGCEPTYPKEELPEAVQELCKREYDLDVEVERAGGTLGIFYPKEDLLNASFAINEDGWSDINSLLLIASRVLLSTDAEVKFYCVIAQDARVPEMQVVIIKYVEDVKRAMYRAISRDESFRRTILSHNLTPQAQKERSVEEVFANMDLDEETREAILDDFFRTKPATLRDIGYWRGSFYLKDITMEEFLVEQMANRIKLRFLRDRELSELFRFRASTGEFHKEGETAFFGISFDIMEEPGTEVSGRLREMKIREILTELSHVFYGYKFDGFDYLVLDDRIAGAELLIRADDAYDFHKDPSPVRDIVDAPEEYFQKRREVK